MSVRLQTILQDFADVGITADKMTADELEALVFAVDRANNPFHAVNAELCGEPVKVCEGVYLWPVTAGAQIWLSEYAERWWPRGSMMYRWAQIYALMNARRQDAFAGLTKKWKARAAVLASMLRVCCHRAELAVAVNRCYGIGLHDAEKEQTKTRPDEMADDFASLVASLEVYSGIKAEHWLWGKSLGQMAKDYCRMRHLAAAFGGGKAMEFELDDALANLARVKAAIVERFERDKA